MKTINKIVQQVGRTLCGLAVVLLASCINDDFVNNACQDVPKEPGLYLSVGADGGMVPALTRSPGEDELNENLITRADVFVFREDGTLNLDGYVSANFVETATERRVPVYTGSGWKNNFNVGETYSVYALANYKGTSDDLNSIQSLDDLKALVDADKNIVKWQEMKDYSDEKTFLMDGNVSFSTANFPTDNAPYELTVPMKRAAVKVQLTLKFSDDWKNKFQASGLAVQVTNFASNTAAIAEGNPLDADQRGYMTFPAPAIGGEKEAFTPNFVRSIGNVDDVRYNGSEVLFYAYVNRWDDLATNETMLLIDLPGNLTENSSSERLSHNFYKIPIISNAKEKVLQRNTFYQITATVNMKGSADVDVPVELEDVQFKTADWEASTVNVGDDQTPVYLVLSESHVDIRNANGYDELEFYSSSPITSVTIEGFRSQDEATAAGVDFIYPGDGTTIPGAFFVNKNNERQEVDLGDPNGDDSRWDSSTYDDEISVDWDRDVTNGKIYLTSTNPENVTKRYITLAVTNEVGTKYVVVEQYPLEYIQPIAGYYSYRDDLKSVGGTYETKGTQQATWYRYNRKNYVKSPANNRYFLSKVFVNNQILGWYWMNNQIYTADGSDFRYDDKTGYGDFPDNNMMYFVTITQTDDKYKIAHPITVNESSVGNQLVAVDSEENNHFVSPSFMLASQLGTVYSSYITGGWEEARKHCAYYVETYTDENNKTIVLDDWRLPTTDEINVIVNFQDKTPDVMAEVLTGTFYYVAYSKATENIGDWRNTQPLGTAFTGKRNEDGDYEYTAAVRCIRDVKPTDAFLQSNN